MQTLHHPLEQKKNPIKKKRFNERSQHPPMILEKANPVSFCKVERRIEECIELHSAGVSIILVLSCQAWRDQHTPTPTYTHQDSRQGLIIEHG